MEDEFAGKPRDHFLIGVVYAWELLREMLSMLPFRVGLPDLLVDDTTSVEEACDVVQRIRKELLADQPISGPLRSLITEGAFEMLHALLVVAHTQEGRPFTDWHADLGASALQRVRLFSTRGITALQVIEERGRMAEPDYKQDPPEQE